VEDPEVVHLHPEAPHAGGLASEAASGAPEYGLDWASTTGSQAGAGFSSESVVRLLG
jgi:hypothetical protein